MFRILESKFGKNIISYLIALIIASRDGLTETEIIELLKQSQLVTGSVSKLWTHFCWIMGRGPMLLQNNHIKLMDNKLKSIASVRYAAEIKNAHQILHTFYASQSNIFVDKDGKRQWCNHNKFIELPYHACILDRLAPTVPASNVPFNQSIYLTDLNWIQTKLKTTQCVQYILNDIYLISDDVRINCPHIQILKTFFELNIRPINYDADQFYPLFKHFLSKAVANSEDLSKNDICQKWLGDFDAIPISYLDILSNGNEVADTSVSVGYDVITNLGGSGYFVASLNTLREEICVWNVPRYAFVIYISSPLDSFP